MVQMVAQMNGGEKSVVYEISEWEEELMMTKLDKGQNFIMIIIVRITFPH